MFGSVLCSFRVHIKQPFVSISNRSFPHLISLNFSNLLLVLLIAQLGDNSFGEEHTGNGPDQVGAEGVLCDGHVGGVVR